jgi:hypothetical protein
VNLLETVEASIIFASYVEETRRDAFISQANTELSEIASAGGMPSYCQRYRTLRTTWPNFRIHQALSVIAGGISTDSEIIAFARR